MTEPVNQHFTAHLLACQATTPALRDKYREELMNSILEEKLTEPRKWLLIGLTALRLPIMGFTFFLAIFAPWGIPAYQRLLCALGGILLLFMVVNSLLTLLRGSWNTRTNTRVSTYTIYILALAMFLTVILGGAFQPGISMQIFFIVIPLMLLIFGALAMMKNWTIQGELNTRERLLKIELQLAELSAKLGQGQGGGEKAS